MPAVHKLPVQYTGRPRVVLHTDTPTMPGFGVVAPSAIASEGGAWKLRLRPIYQPCTTTRRLFAVGATAKPSVTWLVLLRVTSHSTVSPVDTS